MSKQRTLCKCHCRRCGSHFSSLAAFDAHNPGSCDFPDIEMRKGPSLRLAELTGDCEIADDTSRNRVTVYEHPGAQMARDYFAGRQGVSA